MNEDALRRLLNSVREGETEVSMALESLRALPFTDLGFAKLDTHRALRKGFPEVVYCEGKQTEHVIAILQRLRQDSGLILATRASATLNQAVQAAVTGFTYFPLARCLVHESQPLPKRKGTILVVAAGTSDLPVAEEAVVTAEVTGNIVERLYDVGVAGIHRLLAHGERLQQASVLIVVAGMEGALPSVVGGLVRRPVIAVPTSIGYGASFGGLAALLGMLNSCSSGITVVNIDNGFGAGYAASLMNELGETRNPD